MKDRPDVIDTILSRLPSLDLNTEWLPSLEKAESSAEFSGLSKQIEPLIKWAGTEIQRGHVLQATNCIGLAMVVNAAKARDYLGREGVLRASKYSFDIRVLVRVVESLVGWTASLSVPASLVEYLTSVETLLKAGKQVARLNSSLESYLARNRDTALKSVVAVADTLFMVDHEGHPTLSSETLHGYSKEELAEAASYILHLFNRSVGIRDTQFNYMRERGIARGLHAKLLIKAAKIRAYCEAEVLVDGFDYKCVRRGRAVRVVAPTSDLEKSIRLGYVMSEQANKPSIFARIRAEREGEVSTYSLADDVYRRAADSVVSVRHEPVSRYVFKFPDAPQFHALFRQNGFTIEERLYLDDVLTKEAVTWDELSKFEFEGGVTFQGLLKVHRLLKFMARISSNHLRPRLETEPEQVFRSLVPVFPKHLLLEMFTWCVGEAEAEAMIRLMSWKPASGGIVDMQYRAIIDGGSHYLLPMNIAGSTNWYRNFAHTEGRRVTKDVKDDGTVRELEACLRVASPLVKAEYETEIAGKQIEIDVVCRFGEYLFIFECKHALLPCNVFELRTSFKHMKTGASQLSKISHLLSSKNNELELYHRLKWDLVPAKQIVTCIVSGNGMFSGLRLDGHPVRRLRELVNMIETGIVRFIEASVAQDEQGLDVKPGEFAKYCLWDAPELTPNFLREYLDGDLLQKPMFDSMVDVNRSFELDGWKLEFQTYALDLERERLALEAIVPKSAKANVT